MAPRKSYCAGRKFKKVYWSSEEDDKLRNHIADHGERNWESVPAKTGLQRSAGACRRRWLTELNRFLNKQNLTLQEKQLIIELQQRLGNKWAEIARHLPGRTDNNVKNFWNSKARKEMSYARQHIDNPGFIPNEDIFKNLSPIPSPPQPLPSVFDLDQFPLLFSPDLVT